MKLERILLVDDDPDIRMLAKMELELVGGFTVRACGSGDEALANIGPFAPQLILLDVMMPGMDGPAVLARLRAAPETSRIPVIFMTAKAGARDAEALKALGAVDVIAKPFEPMTLPSTLEEIWRRVPAG